MVFWALGWFFEYRMVFFEYYDVFLGIRNVFFEYFSSIDFLSL